MQDFPANSRKAQETEAPREQLKPVTTAKKTERRTGLGRKFKNTFLGGTGRMAADHAVTDVVVPGIRDMIYDALHRGIDVLFYGEGPKRPSRGGTSSILTNQNLGRFDYAGQSRPTKASTQQRTVSSTSRARQDFGDLVIPSLQEANEVLDQMFEVLSRDGVVSVTDLYMLTGIKPEHTDMKWGWTRLSGARAVRLRQGGFILDLPQVEALG